MSSAALKVYVDGSAYGHGPGGIVRMFDTQLASMAAAAPGFESLLVVPGQKTPWRPAHRGVGYSLPAPSLQAGMTHPFRTVTDIARRRRFLAKADVSHATYYTLAPRPGTPHVVSVYDFVDRQFPAFPINPTGFVARQQAAIEAADAVVTISEAVREQILTYCDVPETRIHVVYPSVGEAFRGKGEHESPAPPTRPYLLYVGRRSTYKNFTRILRAYAASGLTAELDLVLCGPRLSHSEAEEIIRLRVHDTVRVYSEVADAVLAQLYRGARAFIFPSMGEGFGIPLLEAMATGCPIIASDIPVFREVAGTVPDFVNPLDDAGFATAMQRSLDADWRRSHKEAGLARLAGLPTWDDSAAALLQVYQELVA